MKKRHTVPIVQNQFTQFYAEIVRDCKVHKSGTIRKILPDPKFSFVDSSGVVNVCRFGILIV
jgi:hypothetical protein